MARPLRRFFARSIAVAAGVIALSTFSTSTLAQTGGGLREFIDFDRDCLLGCPIENDVCCYMMPPIIIII